MGSQYTDSRRAIGKSLQSRRKAAGFKSARSFAEHMGINPNTYTDYEQGRGSFSFEQAWEFADALDCTLDELGGREAPKREYSNPEQADLNGYYESMNSAGRSALVESARLMSGSPDTRIEKDSAERVPIQTAMGA